MKNFFLLFFFFSFFYFIFFCHEFSCTRPFMFQRNLFTESTTELKWWHTFMDLECDNIATWHIEPVASITQENTVWSYVIKSPQINSYWKKSGKGKQVSFWLYLVSTMCDTRSIMPLLKLQLPSPRRIMGRYFEALCFHISAGVVTAFLSICLTMAKKKN